MGAMLTVSTRKVTASMTKQATNAVATYRESGLGSNRGNWARTAILLASVLTAIETKSAVDITELFPAGDGKQYHQAHRALNSGAIRPMWNNVTIVVLKDATVKGNNVTGETTTTGKGLVFVVPAE